MPVPFWLSLHRGYFVPMAPEHDGGSAGPEVPFRAAVFDMDGLLIDSEPLWREAEIRIFRRLGVPLTEELCLETRGMLLTEVASHWFERYPWEGAPPDAVAAEIVDAMALLLAQRVTAKPGVVPALTSCRAQGLRLAIASSSPRRLIEAVVDRLALWDRFDVLHSAETEMAGKPDPAVFLTTARLLAVAPERCVVFEDSPAGVQGALAAGMTCVAVPEAGVPGAGRPEAGVPGAGRPEAGVRCAGGPGRDGATDPYGGADLVIDSLEQVDDALWALLARRRAEPRDTDRPTPGRVVDVRNVSSVAARRRRGPASPGSCGDIPGNSR